MDSDLQGTILIFEDEWAPLIEMYNAIKQSFPGEKFPNVEMLWAMSPDRKPHAGDPEDIFERIEQSRPEEVIDPAWSASLETKDLELADVIVLDLQMSFGDASKTDPSKEYDKLFDRYKGLYVLKQASQCGCLSKVFINSAVVEKILSELPEQHRQLAQLVSKSEIGVYEKSAEGTRQLLARIYSTLDLKHRGYSCDPKTRDKLFLIARRALATKMEPVLILGKSGTGKESAAEHIHEVGQWLLTGNRNEHKMEVVNCGGLTPELARDELFGHVKDAFTGATRHKLGRVLRAIKCSTSNKRAGLQSQLKVVADRISAVAESFQSQSSNLSRSETRLDVIGGQLSNAGNLLKELASRDWADISKLLSHLTGTKEGGSSEDYRDWLLYATDSVFEPAGDDLDLRIKTGAPFGTIFLDEFGELHPSVQALLLRFLNNGEFQPLGYEGTISLRDEEGRLHIRFIGATNRKDAYNIFPTLDQKEQTPSDTGQEKKESLTSLMIGLDEDAAVEESVVRLDLLHRIGQWIIVLPELTPEEVDVLIELERGYRHDLKYVQWEEDAKELLRTLVGKKIFTGQRRQLRTVIMRALGYAKELSALGVSPSFKPASVVTEDIINDAVGPITVAAAMATPRSRIQKLSMAISHWLKDSNVWSDCPSPILWKSVKAFFGSGEEGKTRLGKAFLQSTLFKEATGGEYTLDELEEAWGSTTHNKIRGYLNVVKAKVFEGEIELTAKANISWDEGAYMYRDSHRNDRGDFIVS